MLFSEKNPLDVRQLARKLTDEMKKPHTPTPLTDIALVKTQGLFRAAAASNGFADHARTLERENAKIKDCHDELLAALKKARTCASIPDEVMDLICSAIKKAEDAK